MKPPIDRPSMYHPTRTARVHWTQWAAITLAVGVTVAMLILTGLTEPGLRAYEFHFNPYALLSLAALISNIVVLLLMGRLKVKTDDMLWFSLYITCLALWSAAEVLTRISGSPETLIFWWALSSLPSFLAPVTLYMFGLSYTSPRQSKHIWTIIPLLLGAFMMMFFDYHTQLFNRYDVTRLVMTPWGGALDTGQFYDIITLWFVGLYVLTIVMFVQFYRRTIEPRLKRQARLFMLGTLLPICIGIVTDGVLPAIGVFNIMPTAVLLTAVMGITYSYGILKYRFLALNPLLVATNILETMNEAVIAIKPDFRIDFVNGGAVGLLGYKPDAFSRMRFTDFLTQEWTPEGLREAFFKRSQADGYANFDSVDMRTSKGRVITVKLSASKMVEDGELEGYLVVMTDITTIAQTTQIIEETVEARTREVQETKTKLVNSINSLQFGFLMTDTRPEVVMVNAAAHVRFCHDTSHAPEECHAITVETVQAGLGHQVNLAKHIATCLKAGRAQTLKNIDLDDRTWRVYLSPMMDGQKALGCVVLLQDTTEERLLERSRDEFFSIASHELRTPLTAIKGNSSLILQYYKGALSDPDLKEMVTDIHASSDRLIGIVNDFLDVSRLEQGRTVLNLESISLAKLIENVTYEMGPLLKQKGLYLHVSDNIQRLDALPNIVTDANRLKQIMFNLLGNASKFTETGGLVMEATVDKNVIKLTVTDTGAGIAAGQQPLLFHKFQQAGSSLLTRDSSRGTGLGLYISRLLAKEMGGSLVLERSALGQGSTFALTLPIATPARLRRLAAKKATVDAATGLMVRK